MKKLQANSQGGYIALMATVIIAMVLLVMVAREGFAGMHARFNVLGTELKEQASALAEGRADQALARLIVNPFDLSVQEGSTNILPAGTCFIAPTQGAGAGKVAIRAQAQVGAEAGMNTYANLGLITNISSLYIGSQSDSTFGTIVVQVLVHGGTATSSAFLLSVSGQSSTFANPFAGSGSGTGGFVMPGSYSVSEVSAPAGYQRSITPDCSGTVAAGEIKVCTVTYSAVTTTLTLVAQVTNKFKGSLQPTDFSLFIDGAPAALGQAYTVAPGTHTASATVPSGYLASDWGYNCAAAGPVTLGVGDNKVCIINFADIPPPNPSCADPVMMLDRTGSMSSSELSFEKSAANSLVNLYALVHTNSPNLPLPYLGVGSFGGITTATINGALVPNGDLGFFGILTTTYNDITNAVGQMMGSNSCSGNNGTDSCTDLSAAINAASTELGSARHNPNNEKVLILLSDGAPSLPTGSTVANTGTSSPTADMPDGSTGWLNAANAYTGADGGADANAVIGSGSTKHRYYNFNFPTIPADATSFGIEVDADAWSNH